MIIFEGTPGRVAYLADQTVPATLKPLVRLTPALGFRQHRTIITSCSVGEMTNHQITHTIGGAVYAYSFGDHVGEISLGGLSFAEDCDNTGSDYGFERLHRWYHQNKLSAKREPMLVQLGDTVFKALLVKLQIVAQDPMTWLTQYQASFVNLPEPPPKAVASSTTPTRARPAAPEPPIIITLSPLPPAGV